MSLAEEYISIDTAQKIWQRLREQSGEGKLFYYYIQTGNQVCYFSARLRYTIND
jgi:hypothetical protein